MSILIKGMKMPISCYECRFAFDGMCIANRGRKDIGITNCCPLIEVPTPHGRLIDADDLLTDKSVSIIGKGMIFGGQYVFSESEIVNAPTIIPAEEGE